MANLNLPQNKQEVLTRLESDIKAQLPNSEPSLRTSLLGSIVFALAGRLFDIYQKILIMIQQFFINTASGVYLERWGSTYGITRNNASYASGLITFSGTSTFQIPSGSALQSVSGISYTTQSLATISTQIVGITSMSRSGSIVTVNFGSEHNLASGIVIDSISGATPTDFNGTNLTITVTSSTQFQFNSSGTQGAATGTLLAQWTTASVNVTSSTAGLNTNANSGASLSLSTPIAGVNNTAFVQFTAISGGFDQEDDVSYRQRVLDRIQQPFSFFNNNALINQAKKITGITRVWVFNPESTSASKTISSITRNGQIATATSTNHGLVDGNFVSVFNANQSDYNVSSKRVIVIDSNTFAFVVANSPTTPATGTITMSYSFVEEGQVRIYCTNDDLDNIIPLPSVITNVKNKILEIKPAHVAIGDIIVLAPQAVPVNITFTSLSPNNQTMQTAITNSLKDYFKLSNNVGVSIKLADLNALILQTIDDTGTSPTFTLSLPTSDITIDLGQIGTLGTITYPA